MHPLRRQLRVHEQSRLVGEDEQAREVKNRAGPFQTTDHAEVVLMAIEVGHEDDARLVEAGRRAEEEAGEGYGRSEDRVVPLDVTLVERVQRLGGGGSDR